jgi:uncharacterized protein YdcH (DUF465 family)
MEQRDEELIRTLLPQIPELKTAYEEHARLGLEVDELSAKSFLSPSEEVRRKDLQKQKLLEKDKIMKILSEYRSGASERERA